MEKIKQVDSNYLPQHLIMILGITSLWLFIPSTYELVINIYNLEYNIVKILIYIYINFVSVISLICWYKWLITNIHYSIWYYLDCIFSRILFCILFVLSIFNNSCIYDIILPLFIVMSYICGKMCYNYSKYNLSVFCHLFFRYLGFMWTCYILLNNFSYNYLTILTIIYWLHIIYLLYIYNNLDCNTTLECKKNKYIKESLILFIIIITCLIIKFLL